MRGRTGGRAKDKVASDIGAPFGVSGSRVGKRESPAAASWISLLSPHTPSVVAKA